MPPSAFDLLNASLQGLVLGDGYGQSVMWDRGALSEGDPRGPWNWTDDSEMAFSIARVLLEHGRVDQDALAASFAEHFHEGRMYGPGMLFNYFPSVRSGAPWSRVASSLFGGSGSFGNGSAMRVAPLGAFLAEDLEAVAREARASAEVTHTNPEAIAGAMATALAAALAVRAEGEGLSGQDLLARVFAALPASEVKAGIELVYEHGPDAEPLEVVAEVGNGSRVTCMDTVPFALWVAARHLGDYRSGLRTAVSVGGDIDTLGAIVGGVLAAGTGLEGIPSEWLEQVEAYPDWFLAARTASSQP
jgi:ADP-ribosylglycohydrolase